MSGRKDMESLRKNLPHTTSESDDEVFDFTVILPEEIHVPSQQDPEPLIKSRSRDGAEHVTIRQNGNNSIYAKPGGHGILRELKEMKREMNILVAKDAEWAYQIEDHQRRISALQGRVRHLIELKGSKAIRGGNVIAHEGDAFGDAIVFNRDPRRDRSIYRKLYGLDYQQVLDFHSAGDDGGLFLVLDAHATMVAQGKFLPDDLKVAFNSFLAKVEENWLQPPNKEPNTPLGSAYYTFWKIFNQQASRSNCILEPST